MKCEIVVNSGKIGRCDHEIHFCEFRINFRKPPCFQFQREGKCSKGNDCPYEHDKKSVASGGAATGASRRQGSPDPRAADVKGKTFCRHYAAGSCSNKHQKIRYSELI